MPQSSFVGAGGELADLEPTPAPVQAERSGVAADLLWRTTTAPERTTNAPDGEGRLLPAAPVVGGRLLMVALRRPPADPEDAPPDVGLQTDAATAG